MSYIGGNGQFLHILHKYKTEIHILRVIEGLIPFQGKLAQVSSIQILAYHESSLWFSKDQTKNVDESRKK